jgi:hypothetical protein
VGVFIFVTYIIALAGKFYQKNRLWFTFFTFVLSMAAMVSFNRVVDFIPLRYRIYCCMGILLTVMFYFENREVFHLSRWFKFILPLVMLFSIINSLLYLDKRERDTESLKISACNWQRNRSYFYYFPTLDGSDILKKAEAAGIYFMPEFPMEKIASTVEITGEKWQNRHSTISYYIEFVEETNGYVLIKGWAWPAEISAFVMEDFADIRLWLFNEECHILIHPYLEKRFDFTNRQTGGFFAIIPRAKCPQGIYKLGIEMQKRYIFPVKSSATSIETEAIVMF